MSTRHHDPQKRAAAIADYYASGDTYAQVADRHDISRSLLHGWINPKKNTRAGGWTWREEEVALTGGRWVNVRGVMRWESFIAPSKVDLTDQQRRVQWEDAMFDEDEARMLHAHYFHGCREPRTVVGERVYQRRIKRDQRARKGAA